jgi:hypothetical protein
MAKVYLLLRNNKQTGPHSLDELVQLGLKGDDLIWVEGKSFGWSYPSEVDSLKPYVKPEEVKQEKKQEVIGEAKKLSVENTVLQEAIINNTTNGKKIHVSLPGKPFQGSPVKEVSQEDLLEKKAEELRKRAQAYTPNLQRSSDSLTETRYNRSIDDIEEDYTSWVVKQKVSSKKSFSKKKLAVISSALGIVAITILIINSSGREEVQPQQIVVNQKSTPFPEVKKAEEASPVTDVPTKEAPGSESNPSEMVATELKLPKASAPIKKTKQPSVAVTTTVKDNTPAKVENKEPIPVIQEEAVVNKPIVTSETKEKRTLGQKVGGFFEKLKTKRPEDSLTKAPDAIPDSEGTRNAEKRDDAPKKESVVDLTEFAELNSNIKSSSWMMGIRGLKITLRNKSAQTIQAASAEVKYYSEQNELLEKKVIHFTNVPPKKSAAIAAPDHRLADHIEFTLISATGQGDSYAGH